MTETTDWNELTLPTEHQESDVDEDEWGEIINAMFEGAADELMIKRGPLADRPSGGTSADPNRHRMYLAEDQDPPLLSVDSDTEGWIDINTGGGDGGDADTVDGYEGAELAALAEDETIAGVWSFDNNVDVSSGDFSISAGNISIHDDFGHIALHESDTGEQWNIAVSSGRLNLVNQGGEDGHLRLNAGGDVDIPNGILTANGVDVGSGDLIGNVAEADAVDGYHGSDLGVLAENETVGGSWSFSNTISGDITGTSQRAEKTFGPIVNGGHSDFSTAQDAIDFADTNEHVTVVFPPGTYGGISIPAGIVVKGRGTTGAGATGGATTFHASSGPGVDMSSSSILEDCEAETDDSAAAVSGAFRTTVRGVRFGGSGDDGFHSSGDNDQVVVECNANETNITGSSVYLTGDSSRCIVTNNRNMGTITDNGSGNVVDHNT